tara:strand:- start:40384 stop:40665 length:282 start_codon:yes stop_codon:yes gene_type:complete
MRKLFAAQDDWKLGTIFWFAVVVWFSSSLLSQSVYVAFYGEPYDAIVLLKEFGILYYFILGFELLLWIGIAGTVLKKMVRKSHIFPLNGAAPA